MAENVEQELGRARALIQAKRYEDARAILITIDHPTADKWLARLNQMPSVATPKYVAPPESFTTKLIISIALLFVLIVPGLIAIAVFSREAKEAQTRSGQNIPGAMGLITLNRLMFILVIIALVFVVILFFLGNNPASEPFVYPLF